MSNALFFNKNIPEIGLKVRKTREGSEYNLVENFIDYKVSRFEKVINRKTRLAVFCEPQIDTGYPDIVLAEYNPEVFNNWISSRSNLEIIDLKVLNHIILTGGISAKKAQEQLGIDSKSLLTVIERLLDAGLITRQPGKWKAVRLKEMYGIKRLVAIEAKISNWAEVLNQAQLNKWFASESFTLTPVSDPSDKIVKRFEEFGVGIYVSNNKGFKKVRPSTVTPLPSCYGSLLFNEWIGRRLYLTR